MIPTINLRRVAWNVGLPWVVAVSGLVAALSDGAAAQPYLPDGPNVPVISLNESQEGAAGLPLLPVPRPNGWNEESIWNMEVVGFNDNQGRPSSDDGWIEDENGRYILYMTDSPGSGFNSAHRQDGAEWHVADRRHEPAKSGFSVPHPDDSRQRRLDACRRVRQRHAA
jgi:hypothetical protein